MKVAKINENLTAAILPSAVYEMDFSDNNAVILTQVDFIALEMVLKNRLSAGGYRLNAVNQRVLRYFRSYIEMFVENLTKQQEAFKELITKEPEDIQQIINNSKELLKGYLYSSINYYYDFPKINEKRIKTLKEIGKNIEMLEKLLIISTIDHHGNCHNCDHFDICTIPSKGTKCRLWMNNAMVGYAYTKNFED